MKAFWGTTKKCENKDLSFYFNTTLWNPPGEKGSDLCSELLKYSVIVLTC